MTTVFTIIAIWAIAIAVVIAFFAGATSDDRDDD